MKAIAKEWAAGMRDSSSGEVRDFICAGDVDIKVIGAENPLLDTEIPVRQLLEQIVSKLSIPPFLLGLNWSSTERMSTQQADILTSELEYYRRLLTPVIQQICTAFLRTIGSTAEISWNGIPSTYRMKPNRLLLVCIRHKPCRLNRTCKKIKSKRRLFYVSEFEIGKGFVSSDQQELCTGSGSTRPVCTVCRYPLAGLDAYERQLKRFDIRISGAQCDRVEKFFTSTESAVLFPEFVRRAVQQGIDASMLSDLTAVETHTDSSQYLGCTITETDAYGTVAQEQQ